MNGPDTMLPGGMDVRTAMERLEARMQENRLRQSEARERLTGLEQEKAGFTTDWKPTAWQGTYFGTEGVHGRDTKGMDMGQGPFRYSGR